MYTYLVLTPLFSLKIFPQALMILPKQNCCSPPPSGIRSALIYRCLKALTIDYFALVEAILNFSNY